MRLFMAMTALLLAVMISGPLHAADDFYKGKRVRLIVSSSPGGGNDTYSRLIARHISRHIPGNPTFVVQNMPGAGGIMPRDYLYRKAKRDGTVLEQINWGVWFHQVIGAKRARFDFNKINAVGVAAIESAILFTRKAEFPDWKSVLASKKLLTSGNSGRQSLGYTMGKVMEKLAGKKVFDYVFGYPARGSTVSRFARARSSRPETPRARSPINSATCGTTARSPCWRRHRRPKGAGPKTSPIRPRCWNTPRPTLTVS